MASFWVPVQSGMIPSCKSEPPPPGIKYTLPLVMEFLLQAARAVSLKLSRSSQAPSNTHTRGRTLLTGTTQDNSYTYTHMVAGYINQVESQRNNNFIGMYRDLQDATPWSRIFPMATKNATHQKDAKQDSG